MNENAKPVVRAKAKLSPNGRIVIPAALREQMRINPGDTLLLDLEDGVLKMESFASRLRRTQDELAKYIKPGVLLSEELIAERREEARREMKEIDREIASERIRKAG